MHLPCYKKALHAAESDAKQGCKNANHLLLRPAAPSQLALFGLEQSILGMNLTIRVFPAFSCRMHELCILFLARETFKSWRTPKKIAAAHVACMSSTCF